VVICLKRTRNAQLLLSLRQFEAGQPPLSPRIAKRILQYFQKNLPPTPLDNSATLTPRETEVLALIGRGLRVSEVAETLQLASTTVTSYIKNIYAKLNISNRTEAALEAARRGLT
jgi:DNA-binding NarL/FixJ family response regulator